MMKNKYLLVFHCLFVLSPWPVELSHGICCNCAPRHSYLLFILVIIATEKMLKVNSPIRRNSCLLPTFSLILQMSSDAPAERIWHCLFRFKNWSSSWSYRTSPHFRIFRYLEDPKKKCKFFQCSYASTCKYECSEQKKIICEMSQ